MSFRAETSLKENYCLIEVDIMTNYTSKRSFLNSLNVDRRFLVKYVSKKLNNSIPLYHIAAVINFLFEELMAELKSKNSIVIGNFGKFFMKKLGPRRHYDVVKKTIKMAAGNLILRFKLNKDIQEILTNNLDVAKTFKEHQNG